MLLIPQWHSNLLQPEEVTVEIPRRLSEVKHREFLNVEKDLKT